MIVILSPERRSEVHAAEDLTRLVVDITPISTIRSCQDSAAPANQLPQVIVARQEKRCLNPNTVILTARITSP
ncbi:hypothetical protein HETIRDRAFT_440102 [Heterobasidion irregulare TC 32-1]|uniref:Uncharacterized protein n=1 Tax=Heterobasidion irregulare (strain TC 32-1) TaxID=747525 RepID=W4K7T0_HETIT|nr:uncharacterized protein HETIRDRAFT_440102 [Heterobasidion irregulare TC 32-1]ETW81843.1 hypothetical protein HETIRDRAFT_440102 [Heterobasidion irregulare TC 32-1]